MPVPLVFLGPAVPLWMSTVNVAAGFVGFLVTVLLEIRATGASNATAGTTPPSLS